MPRTDLRPPYSWLTGLILVLVLVLASPVWGQPGGKGPGGGGMGGPMGGDGGPGPGKGRGRKGPPRFDMRQATTITGQVETLGSYGTASWRSLPGMAVQGLTLKTDQGNIEVFLGPPSYVTEQKFKLQRGDTLEVKGFRVLHEDTPAFFAAAVKNNKQTLTLLDKNGLPLWKEQESGGPGSDRAGRGGRDSGMGGGSMGGGMIGGGGMGRGR
ncbi:MAG: hypothetical protein ACOZF2_04720 [Thermodesulfobacteriota bacterium]